MSDHTLPTPLAVVVNVVTLPAVLAHELTHAAASAPWAAVVAVVVEPRDAAAWCRVEYRDGTPAWAVVFGHYAPLIGGITLGVAALAWAATTGFPLPETAVGWLKLSVLAIWWAIYVTPSAADRSPTGGGHGE